MVGYDFDKTIYKHDSSTQFFVYMIFSRPYLLVFSPWFAIIILLYGLRILGQKRTKECLFFFITWHKNIDRIVDKFWARHANKIEQWYTLQKKDDDVIISASLEFLIKPVMEMLRITNYIATNFDTKTGKILGRNCYAEEKRVLFEKRFGKIKLEAFYSDSLSDLPMMEISDSAFLVKRGVPEKIDISKVTKRVNKKP